MVALFHPAVSRISPKCMLSQSGSNVPGVVCSELGELHLSGSRIGIAYGLLDHVGDSGPGGLMIIRADQDHKEGPEPLISLILLL